MKKRTYFLYALATLMFAACSESLPGGGGEEVLNPDGESWVALNIQTKPTATKALNNPEQEPGTPDESNVDGVLAIFFDASDVVTASKTLTTGAGGEAQPGQATGAAGKPFKVPNTSKKVLIVINPVGLPAITDKVTTYDVINAAVEGTVSATGTGNNIIGTAQNSFMMTNALGGLEPQSADLKLHSTESAASGDPCTVHVDRVSSKVRLYMGNSYGKPNNVYVQEIGWLLNVTNKLYFPVSERRETFLNTNTPFDLYGLGSYREDPNYNHALIDYPSSEYEDNYKYYTGTASTETWNVPGGVEYCLENTQVKDDNVHAYTTHVIFKAQYTPSTFDNPGSTADETYTADQAKTLNWIRVGSGNYTYATLMNWIENEMTSYYSNTGYTPSLTNAFNDYLDEKSIGRVDTTRTAGSFAEMAAAVKDKFVAKQMAFETKGAGMHGTVYYYVAGVNFYQIMIKHDNKDDETVVNELGEFGVVRNSVYDLTITSVNNPGYPIIPDPNPDVPDEDKDGWISIKININPWTWYTQEVPL